MTQHFFWERKQLHEIDCLVLDAILTVSFDWKELANRLSSIGRQVPQSEAGVLDLPHVVQRMAHSACRIDSELSRGITETLNSLHEDTISKIMNMETEEICDYVHEVSILDRAEVSGLLWALATDERECAQILSKGLVRRIVTELFFSAYQTV